MLRKPSAHYSYDKSSNTHALTHSLTLSPTTDKSRKNGYFFCRKRRFHLTVDYRTRVRRFPYNSRLCLILCCGRFERLQARFEIGVVHRPVGVGIWSIHSRRISRLLLFYPSLPIGTLSRLIAKSFATSWAIAESPWCRGTLPRAAHFHFHFFSTTSKQACSAKLCRSSNRYSSPLKYQLLVLLLFIDQFARTIS